MNAFDIDGNVAAEMNIPQQVSPELYGAKGDGVTDDSAAIKAAFAVGGNIVFHAGKTYKINSQSGRISIEKDSIIDLNGATIIVDTTTTTRTFINFHEDSLFTGYSGNGNIVVKNGTIVYGGFCFAHGENIEFRNIIFKYSNGSHYFEICACKNFRIIDCQFIGMRSNVTSVKEYINIDPCDYAAFPYVEDGGAFFDGTVNDGLYFHHNLFVLGDDAAYQNGYNAIGTHYAPDGFNNHKNIYITDNIIEGFSECGIRANQMDDVYITGNKITASVEGVLVGDKASVNGIVVVDNYIDAPSLVTLTSGAYTDATISGNVTKGTNQL